MKQRERRRVLREIAFTPRDEDLVRRGIRKYRGRILKKAGDRLTVSFSSEVAAQSCAAWIVETHRKGPPAIPASVSGSGSSGSSNLAASKGLRDAKASEVPKTQKAVPEQVQLEWVQYVRAELNREWASWAFRGVDMAPDEAQLLTHLLRRRGYSHLTPVTPAIEPFGYPPREFQNWLRKKLPNLRHHRGDLWPVIEGKALEILEHLKKLGVSTSAVLAAVEMGPEDSQRLAAQTFRCLQSDVTARLERLGPALQIIERGKSEKAELREDPIREFDRALQGDVEALREIQRVVTKYLETDHIKVLLRSRHTPLVQRPIKRLAQLLIRRLGVRGKHAKPYKLTADFLAAYRPDLFAGLTAHQVRSRVKPKKPPPAPES